MLSTFHTCSERVLPWLLYLLSSQDNYSYVPSGYDCNTIDSLCLPSAEGDLHPRNPKGTHSSGSPRKQTGLCGMAFTHKEYLLLT